MTMFGCCRAVVGPQARQCHKGPGTTGVNGPPEVGMFCWSAISGSGFPCCMRVVRRIYVFARVVCVCLCAHDSRHEEKFVSIPKLVRGKNLNNRHHPYFFIRIKQGPFALSDHSHVLSSTSPQHIHPPRPRTRPRWSGGGKTSERQRR